MFEALPDSFEYAGLEQEVLDFWEKENIFQQSLDLRQGGDSWTFYEGPPTANGRPGIHHVISRTLKDMMCRYQTMNGKYVHRKAGWDTHGLPVEIAVEKELGIKEKKEIETFGIKKFNDACKEYVARHINMDGGWDALTKRMGYWLDMEHPYITFKNDYIESVWWALKQFFDKGLIYKGFKIIPQSPTIETPLSSHELSLGYRDVRDPNCYIKLKITSATRADLADAELLVWTTTPWTLISNVALAAGRDIDYVKVRNTRTVKRGDEKVEDVNILVLAKARVETLDGESEVLAEFKGEELIGTRYEQIFPYVDLQTDEYTDALSILPGDFVTTDDGSGIVHMAPAFGQDDYDMSKRYKIPVVQPVTPGGRFTEEAGPFAGRTVKTFQYNDRVEEGADKDIVIALKQAGKIYRSTNDYLHSYPHCWRTDNPIIYFARSSWFINSPAYRDRMIELNKTIRWQPPEIGTGRFGNWLDDVKEWSLSRDRYWGTPLPIWVSENDEQDKFAVGSIAELKTGLYEREDGTRVPLDECGEEIDLHRPFVDNVVFERDGKVYRRTPETIDVWFDSGSMPFAQLHYPFENKGVFEQAFPADFIAEGIDQTRGWFYTLHNIATALFDKPAYKGIIVNDLILDKKGQKMSKSRGNTVNPFTVMDQLGADAVRWYLLTVNPPWKPVQFNEDEIARTVIADFFRSLTNVYAFMALYANIDGFSGDEATVDHAERPEIDRWIISRLNTVLAEYRRDMDVFEVTRALRNIRDFMINDVSNWYVRRNRRRFWKGENDANKLAAYQTLREVLLGVCSMIAPAAPFLPEYLYLRLRTASDAPSIHMTDMPHADENKVDGDLEKRMRTAQTVVFLARSLRERSRIKTRQPLRRILVPVDSAELQARIESVGEIIREEINVKTIEFVGDDNDIVKKSVKPDFKVIGKKYGKQTKGVAAWIRNMSGADIAVLERDGGIEAQIDDATLRIEAEDVEIQFEDIEGWLVASEGGVTVALDTELNPELINEGLAREFVNRIQNMRKDAGFDVTDRISIVYRGSEQMAAALEATRDYICAETLCENLHSGDGNGAMQTVQINEEEISVGLTRI